MIRVAFGSDRPSADGSTRPWSTPRRPLDPVLAAVTERIVERSREPREAYLARIDAASGKGVSRSRLGCTNLAHAFAASEQPATRKASRRWRWPNLAIVSAYNDMLSAHQPLERYPALIKRAAREAGAVAQFAGGVPAMCDGVTQGQPGMELSLFSRDVIAMSTGVALSHDAFDAVLCLGVCDKIVPGLLIGALAFGHLPIVFVPAGPMPSGLPNADKARVRARVRGGQGRPRRAARSRDAELPLARHLHLLRHRQQQPVPDGSHGAARARRRVRQSRHPAARRAHRRRDAARRVDHGAGNRSIVRSAASSTSVPSSTRSSRCWRPAARPTTPSTSSRSPRRPASASTGTTSTSCRTWCRCWRASIPTARPT